MLPALDETAPAIEMAFCVDVIAILLAAFTEPVELTVCVELLIMVAAPVVDVSAPEMVRLLSVRRLIALPAVKLVTEL